MFLAFRNDRFAKHLRFRSFNLIITECDRCSESSRERLQPPRPEIAAGEVSARSPPPPPHPPLFLSLPPRLLSGDGSRENERKRKKGQKEWLGDLSCDVDETVLSKQSAAARIAPRHFTPDVSPKYEQLGTVFIDWGVICCVIIERAECRVATGCETFPVWGWGPHSHIRQATTPAYGTPSIRRDADAAAEGIGCAHVCACGVAIGRPASCAI